MTSKQICRRVAVTGAAGFIGRAVVDRLDAGALGPIELRLNDIQPVAHPAARVVTGTYADAAVRAQLTEGGVDILFHLASLPGGASERDPALGRSVNLDGTIALIDAVSGPAAPIVVYASSIAALGHAAAPVTADTALRPAGSYGTHKAMIELYLADLTRRGLVDGRAVRPAGIVARPRSAYAGFATAWMSDLFHAAAEGRAITVPAHAAAHIWLQSVAAVADNLIHAARMPAAGLPTHRAWTLPATVARLDELVAALACRTGHAPAVTYAGGAIDQPPLDPADAIAAGFVGDGDTAALAAAVLAEIARGQPPAPSMPHTAQDKD